MKAPRIFALAALAAAMSVPAGATLIDGFTDGVFGACVGNATIGTLGCVDPANGPDLFPAADALGGNRVISATYTAVAPGFVLYGVDGGSAFLFSSVGGSADFTSVYGALGPLNADVTVGTTGIHIQYQADHDFTLDMIACTDGLGCGAVFGALLSDTLGATLSFFAPFASFLGATNFADLDLFVLTIHGTPDLDLDLKFIESSDDPAIPEPGTMVLMGAGLVAVSLFRRRK